MNDESGERKPCSFLSSDLYNDDSSETSSRQEDCDLSLNLSGMLGLIACTHDKPMHHSRSFPCSRQR